VSAGRDGEEEQGSVSVPVKKAERFCVRGTNLTEVKVVVDRVSAGHHESDHVEHGRGAASLDVGLPVLVLCLLNREGHAGGEEIRHLNRCCCCPCCSAAGFSNGPIHEESRRVVLRRFVWRKSRGKGPALWSLLSNHSLAAKNLGHP
jgi:hypothetical protein